MPFQAVPNGALVTVKGTLQGEKVVNTLGFGLTTPGPVTLAALAALASGVDQYWANSMVFQLPDSYVYDGVSARVLDVLDGFVAEDSNNSGSAGQLAGNVMPNNVTYCVSFRTGLGGATNRGRNYVCGLLEADVTGNNLSTIRANLIRGLYQDMMGAGGVANGWIWSVISRKLIAPSPDGRAVPITSVVLVDARVDTQRRRLPR